MESLGPLVLPADRQGVEGFAVYGADAQADWESRARQARQEGLPQLAEQIFSRILWWGERTPYWGDSFASNYVEYRKDTPLQSTFDASSVAQAIVFGMFGIRNAANGEVTVDPHPPGFSPRIAQRGVRLRGQVFDVVADGRNFHVTSGGKTQSSTEGTQVVLPARP